MNAKTYTVLTLFIFSVFVLVVKFVETKKFGYRSHTWTEALEHGFIFLIVSFAVGLFFTYRKKKYGSYFPFKEKFYICSKCEEAYRMHESKNGDCPKCKVTLVPLDEFYSKHDE